MHNSVISIDIAVATVSLVVVRKRLSGPVIVAAEQAAYDRQASGSLSEALGCLLTGIDTSGAEVRCAIPMDEASFRSLPMPFPDRSKVARILPNELEPLLPWPMTALRLCFSVSGGRKEGCHALAVMLPQQAIDQYHDALFQNGLFPHVLTVRPIPNFLHVADQHPGHSGLLLSFDGAAPMLGFMLGKRLVLLRSLAPISATATADSPELLLSEIDRTMHGFRLTGGQPFLPASLWVDRSVAEPIAAAVARHLALPLQTCAALGLGVKGGASLDPGLDNAVCLGLMASRRLAEFNFVPAEQGGIFPSRQSLTAGTVLALVFCGLLAFYGLIQYTLLQKRYAMLDSKVKALFQQTLPDVKRIVDPVTQMRNRLHEGLGANASQAGTPGRHTALGALQEISQRIPAPMNGKVTAFLYERESIVLKGELDSFNAVDQLRSALEKMEGVESASIANASLDKAGKQVDFEIRLRRKR